MPIQVKMQLKQTLASGTFYYLQSSQFQGSTYDVESHEVMISTMIS